MYILGRRKMFLDRLRCMVSKYCGKCVSKFEYWVYKIVIVMFRICFKMLEGYKKGDGEIIWNKIGRIYL